MQKLFKQFSQFLKESQDVGGNPDRITLGLGLRLGGSSAIICVGRHIFCPPSLHLMVPILSHISSLGGGMCSIEY